MKYGEISEDGLASMRTRLEDLLSKLDGTEENVTLYYNYQEKLAATCPEAIAVGSRSCSRPTRMAVSKALFVRHIITLLTGGRLISGHPKGKCES